MHYVKKHTGLIIVIILGLLPLFPLLHPGLPLTHDGQDHVARIANFYASLSEGNIIPRWAGNLNWGYGHAILMFLYPLPSYATSFFHLLGFSFVNSLKIVFGLAFVLSGITMYFWMRNVLGENAGIIAGVLYMYAPYRFVDMYVRGAIGEHVAFLFAPLIFYFLLKLALTTGGKMHVYGIGLSLSIAGLLLSHNALSLMFLPIAALYAFYLVLRSKEKILLSIHYSLFTFLGFCLASFFIIPAYFEGKYTLRDIVTGKGEYKGGFVSILDFFNLSWSFKGSPFLSKQIGIVQIISIILGLFAIRQIKKQKQLGLYILMWGSLLFFLFLMLPVSNIFWEKISLLQKFQFPWRLLSVVAFTSSVLGSFSILWFKNPKLSSAFVIVLCTVIVILYFPYYQVQGYLTKPESFYTGVYPGTTDTGESSPIWSVRFMEHSAAASAQFIDGNGTIRQISRNSTSHTYKINVVSSTARIRENTLYFPNWEVMVNGRNTKIEFQDIANRGLITFYVPKGISNVVVQFKNTKLRTLANYTTIISFVLIFIFALYTSYIWKFKKYAKK